LLPNGKVLVAGGYHDATFLSSAELYDPQTGLWSATTPMSTNRSDHTATLLQNGKVLVAGGYLQFGFDTITLASAELYDPVSGTWSPTGSMPNPHAGHTATLLPDGKVLIAGGYVTTNFDEVRTATSEIYDPVTGVWTSTANSLATARDAHTATLLQNGKVLVAGGFGSNLLSSAELFDPATRTWSTTGSMRSNHLSHTASMLPDGRVLVAGGQSGSSTVATAEIYNPANGTWTLISPMLSRRQNHSATLLPNGTLLVAGGSYLLTSYATAEIYNPATGLWSSAGTMPNSHIGHTATLLPNGKVLIAAGFVISGFDSIPIAASELYDPLNGSWFSGANMVAPRAEHTATLLPSGKILLAGGTPDQSGVITNGAEIYDTVSGTTTNTGDMVFARSQHLATLLPNGKVLVVCGQPGGHTNSAELYDPDSGAWTLTPPMPIQFCMTTTLLTNGLVFGSWGLINSNSIGSAIYNFKSNTWSLASPPNSPRFYYTATALRDGRVLMAGGEIFAQDLPSTTVEIYDPASDTWTNAQSMTDAREYHAAILLPNGKVLVAGGSGFGGELTSAELYDPVSGTWTATGDMQTARENFTLTLLPNGKVLAAAGVVGIGGSSLFTYPIYTNSTEIYDPLSGTWSSGGPLATARGEHTATVLPTGNVLIAGGRTNTGSLFVRPTDSMEIYNSGLGYDNSWQPQITDATSLRLGGQIHVAGLGFRGISGASGGDGQDSPTDYPILQLRAVESGQTFFVPALDWTTNSFTSVAVTNFPVGYVFATIIVNGIPSVSKMLSVNDAPAITTIFLTNVKKLPSGFFQFSFTNTPGASFTAFSSTNLTTPRATWTVLGSVTETSPGNYQFTDPQPATDSVRFYSVRAP
jgi:N-acetylneuraminic acid mutarotase